MGARSLEMLVSVITPCFNEEDNVEACRNEVRKVFEEQLPEYAYEHIFSDNASHDKTVERLLAMAQDDKRVKIIVNARNLGTFRNTFNALKSASGDAVVVQLPADLQDPPSLIPEFIRHWKAGYKVVYGIRRSRRERWYLRRTRWLYYRLVAWTTDVDLPVDTGEFQMIDRSVADKIIRVDDYYPYIRGLIAQCSQQSIGVEYTWQTRRHGTSKHRLYHLIDQALNGFVSTSNVPMRLSILLGFALAFVSIIYALAQMVLTLIFFGTVPPGIQTLIVGLFFFSGVQLLFMGILGEYIAAIHSQVRRGPVLDDALRINFESSDHDDSPHAEDATRTSPRHGP